MRAESSAAFAGNGPLDRRAGQMLVFSTLSLMFLFTVMGLSVDLGYSYFKKLQTQTAADSAAEAATVWASKNGYTCGSGVTCGTTFNCANPPTSPPTTPFEAGCLYAQTNGFVNGGNQSVSLIANNTAPPNETGNSPALWIQANVSETVPHLFLYLAGSHSGAVAGQAMGGVTVAPSTSCVYILSGSAANALSITGGASMTASGCGVYDNSSSSSAIYMTGSASLKGTQIKVHGGTSICSYSCTVTPAPTTGSATVTDPFASLPAPAVGSSCGHTNWVSPGSGSGTLNQGVYCGGITVGGTYSLTLTAGTYIMFGGGFNIGNSGKVTGSGVTIFLTGGTMGGTTYTASGMQLSGASTTTLSAPPTGTYEGVLFYQDRGITYTTGNAQGGSAVMNCTGSFYFPTTSMSLSGAVSASKIAMIASTLSITGSATFNQDLTGAYTGLATHNPTLIQ